MKRLKRLAPLLVSLALLLGVGAVGLAASTGANRSAQAIHRMDRLFQERTLASLANQFFLLTFKEAFDFANSPRVRWSLRPNDPGDRALLRQFTERSAMLKHGAVLVGLDRRPLTSLAKPPGLPEPTDVGFLPLLAGLLSQKPGLSALMTVDGVPMVGLGVPIMEGAAPRAVLVAFFRADDNPLQTYNERLAYGKTGRTMIVDSQGSVVSSSDRAFVGRPAPPSPAWDVIASGGSGFRKFTRDGRALVSSFASMNLGGWGTSSEQSAAEFFGPIRSGGLRVTLALLALLIVAAGAVAFLNHRRQVAFRTSYDYKGALLANTTHELKTPLTAIHGAAMTLGTRWRTMKPEQVDLFLSMIHRRCAALSMLIEKILQGARIEAGRETALRAEPLEVGAILRGVRAEFQDASPDHPIVTELPAGELWVKGDGHAVDQVVGLLVENAIKYSPDGGEVRVEVEDRDTDVVVRVADPGIGMGEEDIEHVFEPYFRARRSDSRPFGGVGLGLSIARHLVRRMGGEIWATSTPNVGSVFSFSLAKADPSGRPAAPALIELNQ